MPCEVSWDRLIGLRALACFLAVIGSNCSQEPVVLEPVAYKYEQDAKGRSASIARTISLTAADGPAIGLVSPGSICGGHLYVADSKQATVQRIRLSDGVRDRTIGSKDGGLIYGLASPQSALADCANDSLFVLQSRSTIQFRLSTGEAIKRVETPESAGPGLERPVLDGDAPVFSGLWMTSRDVFPGRKGRAALEGFALGYRFKIPLASDIEAVLPLVTVGCRSMSSSCLSVSVDNWQANGGGWIACQGGGAYEVGVYSRDGVPQRKVDIRSPLFATDSTSTENKDDIPKKIAWHQRNSSVKYCAVFGDYLVTGHYLLEPGQWSPGTAMAPRVFVNVHRLDGTPVLADVGIRDFPTASDERRLYVIAYGKSRANDGGRELQMDEIPIIDESGKLVLRPS